MPELGQNPALNGKMLKAEKIQQMKGQGLSNNQIIQALQRDGYTSSQIFEALNQSSIQSSAPGKAPLPEPPTPQSLNTLRPSASPMATPTPPPIAAAPPMPMGGSNASDEELIEAIIDEKWNDLLQDINKIIAWKDRTTQQITGIEQQFKDLKEQFEKLHQAVVGKVGEYDQHILQVGAEVKAMEKVFSKVLPAFTENVAELSRISNSLKSGTKKK